jgi:hypothetical protein
MHESRTARRPALADISGGGFFIRRVESPGAVLVKGAVKPLARRALSQSSNKENVPPVGAVRGAPKRKSPLPDWYPRTPLRDITSIVKVVDYFLAVLCVLLRIPCTSLAFLLVSNSILLYLVYELYSIICYSVAMFELSVIVFRMPG